MLNTELKVLAKILMEHLQSVARILLGSEKTCAVKGWTIQSNLYLIHTILEGIRDDEQAALINLIGHLIGSTIGTWLLSCRLPDANPPSAGGLDSCIAPPLLWYRWMECGCELLGCLNHFVRVAHCHCYFRLWRWSLKIRTDRKCLDRFQQKLGESSKLDLCERSYTWFPFLSPLGHNRAVYCDSSSWLS